MRVLDGAFDLLIRGNAVGRRRSKCIYGCYEKEDEDEEQLETARRQTQRERLAEEGALDRHRGRVSNRKDRQCAIS